MFCRAESEDGDYIPTALGTITSIVVRLTMGREETRCSEVEWSRRVGQRGNNMVTKGQICDDEIFHHYWFGRGQIGGNKNCCTAVMHVAWTHIHTQMLPVHILAYTLHTWLLPTYCRFSMNVYVCEGKQEAADELRENSWCTYKSTGVVFVRERQNVVMVSSFQCFCSSTASDSLKLKYYVYGLFVTLCRLYSLFSMFRIHSAL